MSAPASRPPLPELPVVLRPTRTRAILLSGGSVIVAVFTVIALLLPGEGKAGWHLGDRIAFIGSGLLILAVLTLLSRPKVLADADGVTVVNLTTIRRLAWAEVLRVNLRPGDAWVHLDLADGTSLAAMGIQPGVDRAQAIRDARILRALAEAHGTGSPAR
ncbi:PH domain-containing protein [Streptomyces meridianus]|uniref:PH domain-containing protein n=1 Tax=Streptomyces meridianus TaxID=2938945 RepID=A0ABT0XCM6_9ACTN|nr:PH domain-containing protein [Streptomyces meridianus]MCM2580271.1 PH domain-containing protein [Streptomyces meridianus]